VIEANDALAATLGCGAPEALEGRALVDHDALVHPDRLRLAMGHAHRGDGSHIELALEVDGRSRLLSVALSPVRDDDGRTASILFEGVDITSSRERERLEHLMVLVGETVAVGGFTVHPQPEEVRLHASSAALLAVPEGRESLADFAARFGPEDAPEVLAGLRFVLKGSDRRWSRDLPYRGDRWVRLYASSHPTSEPGEWCVGAVQDVTQQRVEEAEFRHAQRLDALGRLAGGVAHDFNNLLTAIMGSAELLLDTVSASDRPMVDEITLAANLGKAMTQRLLTLARKQPAHPVSVDLGRHLVEAIPLWRRMVGERVHVQVAVDGREHWVRFDPRLFDQVIMNLLLNARDALPAGGTIEVGLDDSTEPPPGARSEAAARGWHRLTVRDHGCGMSPSTVERVLEPFFTTKGGEGTGLGLSTSLAIVQQAGGVLRIDSREGEGTVVTVWLPRYEPRPESRPERAAQAPLDGALDVLLVEDDARVRRAIARMLKYCGHRVHAAQGASAAENVLEQADIDLVLTDVVMPGVSGPELAERLRARRPGLPVLFMSGYPGPETRRLGMVASDALLPKPFTLAELEAKVREVGVRSGRAADRGADTAGDDSA
jgi:signal transduction histidine kinase